MTRILIVEDEEHLADGLRFNLEAEGFEVEIAFNGEVALDKFFVEKKSFDAIVLDVMMPKKSGFEVARTLREAEVFTPILMLTALGRPEDVLCGFEAGADDYLPKPFDLAVFLARLKGLLRRREWFARERRAGKGSAQILIVNGRMIDFENLELKNGTETIRLTLMEARLLRYLIENAGKPVSRKNILEEVWSLREDTDTRAIDNFIVRLRKYLETDPNKPQILQTVRGIGYRLKVD
jgi:DNA-binding response OmpR family regulator